MKHVDIYYVIAAALVLLLILRFAAKMMVKSLKWTLYVVIALGAAIYVVVRTR
jgi:hypothetical protein